MSTKNRTAAEIVAALKKEEITHAEITVQAETVARWTNYINGRDVETVHTFKPGDVVRLGSWRPEGMHATTADGFEMFVFWRYLEQMTAEDTNTVAATVAANETPKYTREQLAKLTAEAFGRFYGVNVQTMDEDRQRLVDILDAIEEDLTEHVGEDIAYTNDDESLSMFLKDPLDAFNRGRFSYGFNPFHRDNNQDNFRDSAEYFAVDGYGNLCSIDSREDLACWYDPNISDYLSGNYSEPDPDALQALAEVFGGDYDNGEADEEGGAE